ncbi:MAG: glycoside hydrolase family 2 TIM barrel-domain containing protein [Candidatus Thermoplasmatota archaeon]|nr:glycoside hydrolase family 2 TIM barrel-domain containing protein [Candidatus Thermoplasmatota archaeon]
MKKMISITAVGFMVLGAFAGCFSLPPDETKNMQDSISSFILEDFNHDAIPKPEHPRPDFQRENWLNLNGVWDFDFDPMSTGETEGWQNPGTHAFSQVITVPFCWESAASGLEPYFSGEYPTYYAMQNPTYMGSAWYQRTVSVPEEWAGSSVLLKFGAVDWECKIWIDGNLAGQHVGGYSAFEIDITQYVSAGKDFTLTLKATDPSDSNPEIPRGKQGGLWYIRCSGIWQTAYLEACPSDCRISGITITTDIDNSTANFEIAHFGGTSIRVTAKSPSGKVFVAEEKIYGADVATKVKLQIQDPELWSPDAPNLYDAVVELLGGNSPDAVKTYFGMRKIEAKWAPGHSPQDTQDVKEQYKYIYLNGEPIYLRGLLDQSYNPWGIYTYVTENDLKYDIEKMKGLGFNYLRIHIKADEPRRLYWADKLGMLIMQDMPCFDMFGPNLASVGGRENWELTMRDTITRDRNHPCIFSWILFNENWGIITPLPAYMNTDVQNWMIQMYNTARSLDPTRLIEDNSAIVYTYDYANTPAGGWHTNSTDIFSWHFYINDYATAKNHITDVVENAYAGSTWGCVYGATQQADPLMNSEYGGIGCADGNKDVSWCFKYLTTELRLRSKICGFLYTEVTDVEWEHNGILRYDRSAKDFGYEAFGCTLSDFTGADFLALDDAPGVRVSPGTKITAHPYFSKYSDSEARSGTMKWTLSATNSLGEQMGIIANGETPVEFVQYSVTKLPEISTTLPGETCLATLLVWIESDGKIIGRNYLNYHAYSPAEAVSKKDGKTILTFNPGSYSDSSWNDAGPKSSSDSSLSLPLPVATPAIPIPSMSGASGTVWGYDSGFFEYSLALPSEVQANALNSITILLEASAAYGDFNYQTDEARHQTEMTVKANGFEVGEAILSDASADARGALSYITTTSGGLCGSYGSLVEITIDGEKLEVVKNSLSSRLTLRFEVNGDPAFCNGLRIYDELNGAYPMNPTVIFE